VHTVLNKSKAVAFASKVKRAAAGVISGATALVVISSNAFAAGAIGDQVQAIAQEASTAGGFAASMAMYVGALICFVAGAWALWQSRNPENREGGKVAMGVAGLVICGLLVTGGAWINKAAQTASGGAATISNTAAAVTFQ
jgi:hypothetical protein